MRQSERSSPALFRLDHDRYEDALAHAAEVKRSVGAWLEEMTKGLEPAHYRFCRDRSLLPTAGRSAQFVTCFAVKTAWHTGSWGGWDAARRSSHVEFLRSFQRPDGRFVDDSMQRRFLLGRTLDRLRGRVSAPGARDRTIAAETRQSASTLLQVGARPRHDLPIPQRDDAEVRTFIRGLDWSVPWGAGSHASHLIFFLHTNDPRDPRIDVAFEELDRLRDAASGTWFSGEVDMRNRVNGAMKVLTAFRWTGRPLDNASVLLDTALDAQFTEDGCSFLNRLFVVQQAVPFCGDYRRKDVEALALVCLARTQAFRQADGGFSFFSHGAQRRYFDAYVSLGGRQSDMHGAVMLTWAIAISLELLGLADESGWSASTP